EEEFLDVAAGEFPAQRLGFFDREDCRVDVVLVGDAERIQPRQQLLRAGGEGGRDCGGVGDVGHGAGGLPLLRIEAVRYRTPAPNSSPGFRRPAGRVPDSRCKPLKWLET